MTTRTFFTLAALSVLASACTATSPDGVSEESSNLSNGPIGLSGDYRYSGAVEPVARLTVDVIDTRTTGAAERLAKVRSNGGNCTVPVANTYRCTTHGKAADVAASSLAKAGEQNAAFVASFGDVTGSPDLVSKAPSMTEWQIHQRGTSPLGSFDRYTYLDLGELVKIVLPGSGNESIELLVRDDATLQ